MDWVLVINRGSFLVCVNTRIMCLIIMHDESGGGPKAMPSIAWLINVQEIEPFL